MRTFLLPGSRKSSGRLELRGEDHHYLTRVLRLSEGDSFPGTDGAGGSYRCTILSVGPDSLELQADPLPGSPAAADPTASGTAAADSAAAEPAAPHQEEEHRAQSAASAPQPDIHLYQALLKGKKMETVIRQATEAGAVSVIPVQTERTVPAYEAGREEKKRQRWQKIAAEAVQQCGRTTLPQIPEPLTLSEVPSHWSAQQPAGRQEDGAPQSVALLFHQDPLENTSLHRYLSAWPQTVALCIGPEGGFTAEEVRTLTSGGFAPVRLETPVLRAETAAVFAIGAVHTILTERASWIPKHR
jgi:16S rRNA (uracil1498-N3)-methyltransferase